MTQSTFKYNKAKCCLEEQPRMTMPNPRLRFMVNYKSLEKAYNAHIAPLRSYPTSFKEWPEGDLVEGEHFKLEDTEYWAGEKVYGIQTAVPISSSQPKEESDEDELWSEVALLQWKETQDLDKKLIQQCKSKYKLTKRI